MSVEGNSLLRIGVWQHSVSVSLMCKRSNLVFTWPTYYSLNRPKSIWSKEASDDLNIALLFKNEVSAQKFRTFLDQWYIENLVVKYRDIYVEKSLRVVYVDEHTLERV